MRSLGSLFHDALYPRTRVYQDSDGNFRGTSTDVTPWYLIIGRLWGYSLWLYLILLPLLAPVYFVFAHWYCRRYDAENMAEDPKGWPQEKRQILNNHRHILIRWIMFILLGWFTDWGQTGFSTKHEPTYQTHRLLGGLTITLTPTNNIKKPIISDNHG